jgi:hypothetical protein
VAHASDFSADLATRNDLAGVLVEGSPARLREVAEAVAAMDGPILTIQHIAPLTQIYSAAK